MILLPQKVAYRGTLTGLRISAVDGTAFLDNCAALVPYADGSHLVEIYDASGRMLRGYLSAAGGGETLGDESISNGTFDTDTTGWTPDDANISVVSGKLRIETIVDYGRAVQGVAIEAGGLYYATCNVVPVSGEVYNALQLSIQQNGGGVPLVSSSGGGSRTASFYYTALTTNTRYLTLQNNSDIASIQDFDDVSFKPVTAPSSSGATIVSAKGGATENFAYKDASFTYNATSYAVVVRKAR